MTTHEVTLSCQQRQCRVVTKVVRQVWNQRWKGPKVRSDVEHLRLSGHSQNPLSSSFQSSSSLGSTLVLLEVVLILKTDRLPVVVRFPAGPRVRLKTVDPLKGNGLGQTKIDLDPETHDIHHLLAVTPVRSIHRMMCLHLWLYAAWAAVLSALD